MGKRVKYFAAVVKKKSLGGCAAIFDQHIVALAGDGCLQEGVASEAAALAGHLGLDNLILIYDSNDVTLDAMAEVTQSEDTAKRFESYGFEVVTIDGHDFDAISTAFQNAKSNDNGKPKLIIARTEIGRGIPEVSGTAKGHGEGGAKFAESARAGLGLPADDLFHVSDDVKRAFSAQAEQQAADFQAWSDTFAAWKSANPELATEIAAGINKEVPADLSSSIPEFASDYADATRGAGGVVGSWWPPGAPNAALLLTYRRRYVET